MRSGKQKGVERPSSKSTEFIPRLNLWHGLFFILGVSATLLVVVLAPSIGRSSFSSKSIRTPPLIKSQPMWGQLDYETIELERPDESFPDHVPAPGPISWWFPKMSDAQVEGIIRASQMSPEQLETMLDKRRWRAHTNGWQILPPNELVRDLSLPVRRSLYAVLAQFPENLFIQNPVRIPGTEFNAWLGSCGVPMDKQELIRKMSLPQGDTICFYDGQLLEWFCSPAERKAFAKAATRVHALMMKLHITPQTDLSALINYWARGSRASSMKPFLASLSRMSGGTTISTSFLFPTFARMRLYTYPDSRNDRLAYHQDCFWTAMNFFNETPDYNFFEPAQIRKSLKTDYTEVGTNWVFGDLIMLMDTNKQALHMCVYIADDVVFTKNGATFLAPWVLMKMPDMMKDYTLKGPVQLASFRKKDV